MAEPGSSVGEVLESVPGPSRLRGRWDALSPAGRRLVAAAVVIVLLAAGGLWLRDRATERALAQRVSLTAAVVVASSSTAVPGGEVRWYLRVGNDGARRVSVTSVYATSGRLVLRMEDEADTSIPPGLSIDIPLSVRLTCAASVRTGVLSAGIGVRRQDGGTTRRRVAVESAALVLDVAQTLCTVRPQVRDLELSGPVYRP